MPAALGTCLKARERHMTIRGHCLCGRVEYESSSDPMAFILCHCRDCQYASGGEPTAAVVVRSSSFKITKGEVKGYSSKAESGSSVTRQFCPECGTPLFAFGERRPEIMAIKVGSLDDPSGLKPTAFIWTRSAQPWAHRDPSIPSLEEEG